MALILAHPAPRGDAPPFDATTWGPPTDEHRRRLPHRAGRHAAAEPPRLRDAASAWSRSSAEDGTPVDEGTARWVLSGVAALARAAVERGGGLHCRAG
ncbi:hypothetical protein [Streptomyces sp. NPDC002644]